MKVLAAFIGQQTAYVYMDGDVMASSATSNEFEQSLKILAVLAESDRDSVVTICHKTGLKLVDILQCANTLENAGIIFREKLNGNTFIVLKNRHYQEKLEQIYGVSVPNQTTASSSNMPSGTQISVNRREAILKRRQERVAKANQENEANKVEKKKPTPISAVDLLAIKRSGATNMKVQPNPRTGKLSAPIGLVKKSDDDLRNSGKRLTVSASAFKSININRVDSRTPMAGRSTYMSSMGGDSLNIERTDTNFKPLENLERPSQGPIIPFKNNVCASNEIHEADIRKKLGLEDDKILLSFLMPKPDNEFWKACSAIVNSGGGVVVLGMKKYGNDGDASFFIKSIARPEESKKTLFAAFNDRKNISDCPKNPDFIETIEFKTKKVLAVKLNPEEMSPAPLFIGKNSFSESSSMGCFIYRNGIEHCTEEEVKQLWDARRLKALELNNEEIDWDQTSDLSEVHMESNKGPDIPVGVNESIMPLSHRECVFGNKVGTIVPPSLTKKYPGTLPPERKPENYTAIIHALQCAEPKTEQERAFYAEQIRIISELAIAEKIAKAQAALGMEDKKSEKKADVKAEKPYPTQPKMLNAGGKMNKMSTVNTNALKTANAAFQNVSSISNKKVEKLKPEPSVTNTKIAVNSDEGRRMINDEIKRIESSIAAAKAAAKARNAGKDAEKADFRSQLEAAARNELENELNEMRASSPENPRLERRPLRFSQNEPVSDEENNEFAIRDGISNNFEDLSALNASSDPIDEERIQKLLEQAAAYYGTKTETASKLAKPAEIDAKTIKTSCRTRADKTDEIVEIPRRTQTLKQKTIFEVISKNDELKATVKAPTVTRSELKAAENNDISGLSIKVAKSARPEAKAAEKLLVEPMPKPAAVSITSANAQDMPPKLSDDNRASLEAIALPVVEHPRLPQMRVCEITIELLTTARLKPTEVAELLQKKLVPVRDKIIPKIRETHEITVVDGYYFIKK